MKIDSLEIIAFGKFKNKTINFHDGLNVIYGDNESGKSTIINFIYAMLYGFGDSRGKALSLRDKYVPWDSDSCEGKICVITDDDRHITIYRKSGNVKKYDVLRIYDTDTGEELNINIEQITGVNSDTFLKTLCIRQLSTVFDGGNDEITQKLSNIAEGGDESVNCEKALRILDTIRREIQPQRGSGGLLSELTQKIYSLEKLQKERECVSSEIASLKSLIENATHNTKNIEEEYKKILVVDYTSPIAHISGRIDEISRQQKNPLIYYSGAVLSVLSAILMLFIKAELSVLFLCTFIVCIIPLFKKNNLSVEIEKLNSEREKLVKEKAQHDMKLSEIKARLDLEREKLSSLLERRHQLNAVIPEKAEELSALYTRKAQTEKRLRIISLASEALRDAHANMQKNFTPGISRKASEYFSEITGGKYNKLFCDETFGIRVDANLPRESSFFSGGTVDQLYLSVRLALSDMLFKEKSCAMILDQPFIQYDEIRKKKTVTLLENLPKNRQILLFTGDKNVNSLNNSREILT